jgi:hypothetical protein
MDDEGNLLVSAVIGLAAYGAFDLLRRTARFVLAWRNARAQRASDEEAYRAYAREHERSRTKFDHEKTWNEVTPLPAEYLSEMRAFTSAVPKFSTEIRDGLRAIGCHELAAELPRLGLGRWSEDPETGALSIQLLGPDVNPLSAAIVATGYGRSLPLRLQGTVLVELDDFGRIYGLEVFDREDVLEELRASAV